MSNPMTLEEINEQRFELLESKVILLNEEVKTLKLFTETQTIINNHMIKAFQEVNSELKLIKHTH